MKFRAVDCVSDLFAYTYYIREKIQKSGADFDRTKENYTSLIEQARQCAKSAGIPAKDFVRALFPAFALIDEILLDSSWEHKHQWVKNSLQKTYFNTTNAGELFFTYLDKLDREDVQILEIYYFCLASGFKGNLYQPYQQQQLESYKENTFKKVMGDEDTEMPKVLFPEAGNPEIAETVKRKRWKGGGGFSVLLVLISVLLLIGLFYFYDQQISDAFSRAGIDM